MHPIPDESVLITSPVLGVSTGEQNSVCQILRKELTDRKLSCEMKVYTLGFPPDRPDPLSPPKCSCILRQVCFLHNNSRPTILLLE